MKFVMFHGSFGSPEGNWFPELKEKLLHFGQEVIVPDFPVESWEELTNNPEKSLKQSLDSWLAAFDKIYKTFKKDDKLCFVGHSLGCLFILHAVSKYNIKLDSVIFVSPFLEKLNKQWQIDLVNKTFYKKDFDFEKLKALIPVSYVLYSDNDPYVDKKYPLDFAKSINSSPIFVKKAGHMNLEVNLNEFPLVYELCKTRLDLSLYQSYLAHRRELFSVDYTKGKTEEIIFIDPKDVFDEGVFHFRNLRKSGFCTFYTALDFADPTSIYMVEARKAAKRINDLTRVFIISKLSDMEKEAFKQQVNLDVQSGINVYFCMFDLVRDLTEVDFGIWDEDYLCIVNFDKSKVTGVKLTSRKKDIAESIKWKNKILKAASRIKSESDIEDFKRRLK
ncbi:MAG TPA: alpha/beta fold hydrolase [archaeon]|nr:alpha/beta fold hydrolase [archaeon]